MKVYPMIRKDFNEQAKKAKEDCECGAPWDAHLMGLSQSCHPGIGLLIGYHPNSGCLLLTCPACKQAFGLVQVAKCTDDIFKGIEHVEVLGMIVALFENTHSGSEMPDSLDPLDPSDPSRN